MQVGYDRAAEAFDAVGADRGASSETVGEKNVTESAQSTPTDEARRPCTSCGNLVRLSARFCDSCGARQPAATELPRPEAVQPPPVARSSTAAAEYDDRATQRLARELYNSHLELIKKTMTSVAELEAEVVVCEEELRGAAVMRFSPTRTARLHQGMEKLETLGDRWEEIQNEYNRAGEELDEEFVDRSAELEIDVDMPPEKKERIQSEIEAMMQAFGDLESRIRRLGHSATDWISHPSGRWFEGKTGGTPAWFILVVFGATSLAAFWSLHGAELSTVQWASVLGAPWVALAVIFLWSRLAAGK